MGNNETVKELNQIKSVSKFGHYSVKHLSKDAFVRIYGFGKTQVSFLAVGRVREFEDITAKWYRDNKKLSANYSLTTFQEKVADLIRLLHLENRDGKKSDYDKLVESLLKIPDERVKVVVPIYGVVMDKSSITLGEFTINKPTEVKHDLKKEFPDVSVLIEQHIDFKKDYTISVNVVAKDLKKCQELAEHYLSKFEHVANFITASFHKTNRIGIFNYSTSRKFENYLVSKTNVKRSRRLLDSFRDVKIDSPHYYDESNGSKTIWEMITSEKSELKQCILDAVEWCGKALVETDDSKAILQYIIAIESLLKYDGGKMITPSIVSNLRDGIAFMLGDTYEKRVTFSDTINELYEIRSAITHGGNKSISELSLHTALVICSRLIRRLINDEPYKDFQKKKALSEYLTKLKLGYVDEGK